MISDSVQRAKSRATRPSQDSRSAPWAWRMVVIPSRHALSEGMPSNPSLLRVDPSHPIAAPYTELNWTMQVGLVHFVPECSYDSMAANTNANAATSGIASIESSGGRWLNEPTWFINPDCNARNIFRITRRERRAAANSAT